MKTLIIPQKPSNTGSIYDLASDCYDRRIKFRADTKYAVVLASYHGDNYTTHRTEEAALKNAYGLRDWSLKIIDRDGYELEQGPEGNLVKTGYKAF